MAAARKKHHGRRKPKDHCGLGPSVQWLRATTRVTRCILSTFVIYLYALGGESRYGTLPAEGRGLLSDPWIGAAQDHRFPALAINQGRIDIVRPGINVTMMARDFQRRFPVFLIRG